MEYFSLQFEEKKFCKLTSSKMVKLTLKTTTLYTGSPWKKNFF